MSNEKSKGGEVAGITPTTPAQAATKPATGMKKVQEETVNLVMEKIHAYQASGEMILPRDYSPENAIKGAWLVLQEVKDKNKQPALEVCTHDSIINSLFKMVVLGLSVIKKQCDFIVRGNKLCCDPEYTGNILLAKRFGGLKEIQAQVVYKGDVFVTAVDPKTGRKHLVKHEQNNDSIGTGDITFAYAVKVMNDDTNNLEVMSWSQIQAAWNQGEMHGESKAHKNFPDQMAMRSVYNRACKLLIRASSDSAILVYNDDDIPEDNQMSGNRALRQQNSGQKVLGMGIEDAQVIDETVKETGEKEAPKEVQPANENKPSSEPKETDRKSDAKSSKSGLFPNEPGF